MYRQNPLDFDFENQSVKKNNIYLERLHQSLQDHQFRQIDGFPIGDDTNILAMSNPPYYTICPNPFIPEIIKRWETESAEESLHSLNLSRFEEDYYQEPFTADVSEGKSDLIYNAHSYHTKVPHKAIMRYILHYTNPGDIVFDGFCGTGMTGVAAQLCGDRKEVESLEYTIRDNGIISDKGEAISVLGTRKAILSDLSPVATFIAYNYNTPVDTVTFESEIKHILQELKEEYGWMYETMHTDGKLKGKVNYTVWSEVFSCPECSNEIIFFDEAFDPKLRQLRKSFLCPSCGLELTKQKLLQYFTTVYDAWQQKSIQRINLRPVLIDYSVRKKRFEKQLDETDLKLLNRIENLPVPSVPMAKFPIDQMYHGSRLAPKGFTHIHHLYLKRALKSLSFLWDRVQNHDTLRIKHFLLFTVEQTIWGLSLLNRYGPTHFSQVNRYLSGVYYVSSLISEVSPWYILDGKVKRLVKTFSRFTPRIGSVAISTQSASASTIPQDSIDYIFTDPPFGENIFYADLNYLIESWYRVYSNNQAEAIIDKAKKKYLADYQELMRKSFSNYYFVLKPGRWMTVVFHNSHNAVWNAIQEAILSAGFVVADVRVLDKQQKSYRQATATSVAKQDLVISAYKPHTGFEQRFLQEAGTPEGAWRFIQQHLAQLPNVVEKEGTLEIIAERQDYLLFDRMVAFHIQRGASVPLSANEFYAGLRQRFVERDGMFFLPEQVLAYDQARLQAQDVAQLTLFLNDEKTAIQWLRQQLSPALGGQPQTYQEIQPQFLRQLHQAPHEALPELSEILEQNFLQDEAGRWYVPDPTKAGDLEKLRHKALLREFSHYLTTRGRLRQFRSEAIRAGFADAWQRRDYATIVTLAERLPERVLQEDPDLLMYYDNASLRTE